METVKIVFDIDSKDVKTTTEELKALNKVTNEEVKALDNLSTAAEDAGDGFVSLRSQVRQAKEEAQKAADKYGEFSKEANLARQRAGALADQMGDLNRQVNLLNPEAKAKAFSNLAQGVVGAFAVATGALQAFGVKNKEVEELAMKLQGALNITQGIASFGALKESLQDIKVVLGFTTVAQETLTTAKEVDIGVTNAGTAANKTFIASLATNPIFLTVAAIGALAAAYMLLNDETKSAILNEQELADLKKKTVELKDKEVQTAIDLRVANKEISKQAGEREKIELKRIEDTKELQKQIDKLNAQEKKAFDDARKKADLDEGIGKEQLKRAKELSKEIAKSRGALQEQINIINKTASNEAKQQTIDELNENNDKNEKLVEQNKAKNAKDKAEREKAAKEREQAIIQAEKNLNDLLASITTQEDDNILASITKKENERKAVELANLTESQRARLLAVKGNALEELRVRGEILDENYKREIFNAEVTGKDTTAITAKYNNDKTELAQNQADKEVAINKDKNDQIQKDDAQRLATLREVGNGVVDSLKFIADSLVQGDQAAREEELAQLEDQKNKKIISEEEYQKRLKAIKQKQAEDAKRAAIYNATLDLSRAIIAALTISPPGSVIAANFAAALGGLNLARIIATPIPKFQKGTLAVPGIDMGRDSVHAMLQPGEAVIPVSTNRAYHPAIKAIYEKKISPSEINSFVMSRTSSGGKQSITANVDTYALGRALGKNKGVQIENAQVVGRVIAKELNTYNVRRGW
jgi:hypothetical protein